MRESRSSGSVEGVLGNHDSYSDCRFSRAGLAACQRSSSDARHTPRRERDRMTLNLAPASSMMSLVVIRGAIARRVTLVHRTREAVGTWLWGIVQRQVSIQLPRRGTPLHNAGGACVSNVGGGTIIRTDLTVRRGISQRPKKQLRYARSPWRRHSLNECSDNWGRTVGQHEGRR